MSTIPNKELLRELILDKQDSPVVFSGMIDSWGCSDWTLDQWAAKLGQKELSFRQPPALRPFGTPVWEGQCRFTRTTLGDFVQWQRGHSAKDDEHQHPLGASPKLHSSNWAYADYMHLISLFESKPDSRVLQSVDWSSFGFDDRGGEKSTLWVGSRGAHTPCHYDTYGCNLVAQLIGRKRWVLFPPSDTPRLYPTRIPYEESSVFSQVDVGDPDLTSFPNFQLSRPYIVTLEPGDVLLVPRGWWHYVHSLTTSLSINSWIELDADDDRRLEESVTRMLVTAIMCPCGEASHEQHSIWMNPTEEYTSSAVNVKYVSDMLGMIKCKVCPPHLTEPPTDGQVQPSTVDNDDQPGKRKGSNEVNENESESARKHLKADISKDGRKLMTLVSQSTFKLYLQSIEDTKIKRIDEGVGLTKVETDFRTRLCSAILNPEVVSLICDKLKESLS